MTKHEHQYSIITLREYADRAPSFGMSSELDGCLDWYVSGHSQTRDSGACERSNFRTAVRLLDGAEAEYQVVRFGHWACGWVEHILLAPAYRAFGESLECDDYPILDESDFSEVESDDECEAWSSYACTDFLRALAYRNNCERVCDLLTSDDLFELYHGSGVYPEHDDSGPAMRTQQAAEQVGRSDIAEIALLRRADNRAQKLDMTVYEGTHLRGAQSYLVLSPAAYVRTYDMTDLDAPGVKVFGDFSSLYSHLRTLEGK